jgi:hypothetical protein
MSFNESSSTLDEHGERTPEHAPARATDKYQGDTDLRLRIALAELRIANLEIAVDDLKRQRNAWRAQAERLAVAAQRAGIPVRSG